MSRIYNVGAKRNVSPQYNELTIKKDSCMKHIEKMTRLIGTIATQVIYRDGDMPHFDYRPVYYFDVHMSDNPFVPQGLLT